MSEILKKENIQLNPFFKDLKVPDYEQIINCMHCGLCLPACPTYAITGLEKHSPRGRIRMMKAVADNEMEISQNYIDSLDYCLDCQACVTACPAGVEYGELVEAAHNQISAYQKHTGQKSVLKTKFFNMFFKNQNWLKSIAILMRLYQSVGLKTLVIKSGILKLLPEKLSGMHGLMPVVPGYKKYSDRPAKLNKKNIKVGVITGCVQDVFFNDVNHDTIDVLSYNGYDVIVPEHQQCCGSVFGHNGEPVEAQQSAKKIIDLFWAEKVDFIIINSAGCGSFMKKYDKLLKEDPYAEKAQWFSERLKDVSEFLVDNGFEVPEKENHIKVTYHEPCHLVHGQKISQQPRTLIKALPGLDFVELEESDWCCGSAGIYNITHYEDSMILLERKIRKIEKSGAEIIISGNPGCMIQLVYGAQKFKYNLQVKHPVSLLNEFYKGGVNA